MIAAMLYIPSLALWQMKILLILLGFFASGNVLAYAYGHDIRPPNSAGISLGFVNTWLIGGSAASQPAIGWVLDRIAPSHGPDQHSYLIALSMVTLCMGVATLAALCLKETHARDIHSEQECSVPS